MAKAKAWWLLSRAALILLCFSSENLKELLMKDVFETMFCLHEVSQQLVSSPEILSLLVGLFMYSTAG